MYMRGLMKIELLTCACVHSICRDGMCTSEEKKKRRRGEDDDGEKRK